VSEGFWAQVNEHARNFFTNWAGYDASFWTKIRLTLRNRLKAAFSRHQCCGNHGQPGC
jgi:hypothetical protein